MKSYFDQVQKMGFVWKHKKKFAALSVLALLLLIFLAVFLAQWTSTSLKNNSYGGSDYALEESVVSSRAFGFAQKASPSVSEFAEDIAYPVEPPFPGREGAYDESVERRVIQNGSLSLVVKSLEEARVGIQQKAESLGGHIQAASFYENDYRPHDNYYREDRAHTVRSGSLTIRVPSDKFNEAVEVFKGFALTVQNENVYTNDVTEQYTDLQTRIKNKKAEEDQYRSLLSRATKVEDILKVTQYINQTRNEAERLEGQFNRLSNQVSLSTINVSLTAEEDIEVLGIVWSPWQEIKAGFRSFIQDIVDFVNLVIRFVFALPGIILNLLAYALLVGILVLVFYKIGSKILTKLSNKKSKSQ